MRDSVMPLVRENIKRLKPYSTARHEFEGHARIYLDANENPFENGVNRYPDPLQTNLKERLARLKGVSKENIFLGNGSDEAIDLIYRIFCTPGIDKAIICPPTYGMYRVSADINDVDILEVPLLPNFQLDVDTIFTYNTAAYKVLWICSPNNPTGNLMSRSDVVALLEGFKGIVVIDEAYIDFSPESSWIHSLAEYPNLIVLQTFSKAWGAAAIRLGMAYASREIIGLMNRVKPPYNINGLTQARAMEILDKPAIFEQQLKDILRERDALVQHLSRLSLVLEVIPTDANFVLARFQDAQDVFRNLKEQGIVLRDRSQVHLCEGGLRITVGTAEENRELLDGLKNM